jgi:DNA-binding NtrC family response regulator
MNSTNPTIWIIDSEQWPRACLRAELIERGYEAVGFVRLGRALTSIRSGRRKFPGAIFLDLRGQAMNGADLEVLAATGIPVVLLSGSVKLDDELVQRLKTAVILKRPITLGKISDLLQEIVSRQPRADRGLGASARKTERSRDALLPI